MATAQPPSILLAATLLLLALVSLSSSSPEHLTLEGTAAVRAVDERRILVALDTVDKGHPPDGQVDHIFLFAASESIDFAREGYGSARLEFNGSTLTVTWQGSRQAFELIVENEHTPPLAPPKQGVIRYRNAIGLSHYTGIGALSMNDLQHIRRRDRCDHVPGSCYEAKGYPIDFPA